MKDDFYRRKINNAWRKHLESHPGDFGKHDLWLKGQLIMHMKKVDSLLQSVAQMRTK